MRAMQTPQRARLSVVKPPPERESLRQLIETHGLHPVFQPLVKLRQGDVFGHEALIRGPVGSALHMPVELLAAAARESLQIEFELRCVATALEAWGRLAQPGRLFVNMSADALARCTLGQAQGPCLLERMLATSQVAPRMLVVELTERDPSTDMAGLKRAIQVVHTLGIHIALDDFGDGHSSLRLWAELKPDFVKIDKFFTRAIATTSENFEMVRAIRRMAEAFGTQLVAEGIETGDDLRVLRDLDIGYGQGYFLGRPM
ncbi:MAG: diguanylate cyclase/phosphodiesterase, partial [Variovorax sp.]|nr:diguanylate cyclase/phosphodiesterase [Variovorax sp.]